MATKTKKRSSKRKRNQLTEYSALVRQHDADTGTEITLQAKNPPDAYVEAVNYFAANGCEHTEINWIIEHPAGRFLCRLSQLDSVIPPCPGDDAHNDPAYVSDVLRDRILRLVGTDGDVSDAHWDAIQHEYALNADQLRYLITERAKRVHVPQ